MAPALALTKRPSPSELETLSLSQLETLRRLYNVEMVRRLAGGGGFMDMTYLSDQASQVEQHKQRQVTQDMIEFSYKTFQ